MMEAKVVMDETEKQRRMSSFLPNIDKLLKAVDNPAWKTLAKKKDYSVFWMRSEESPIISVKGEGVVDATVQEINDLMKDFDKANSMDDMFIEGRIAIVLEGTHSINYAAYKMPPLITSRDFVVQSCDTITEDGIGISVGKSVEVPELPDRPGFVRGVLNDSGYVYKPLADDPSKTFVQYVVNVDIKGWIPHWVVNISASDQGANIKRLQEYFAKSKAKK